MSFGVVSSGARSPTARGAADCAGLMLPPGGGAHQVLHCRLSCEAENVVLQVCVVGKR